MLTLLFQLVFHMSKGISFGDVSSIWVILIAKKTWFEEVGGWHLLKAPRIGKNFPSLVTLRLIDKALQ